MITWFVCVASCWIPDSHTHSLTQTDGQTERGIMSYPCLTLGTNKICVWRDCEALERNWSISNVIEASKYVSNDRRLFSGFFILGSQALQYS